MRRGCVHEPTYVCLWGNLGADVVWETVIFRGSPSHTHTHTSVTTVDKGTWTLI